MIRKSPAVGIMVLCLMAVVLGVASHTHSAVDSVYQWSVPVASAPDQGTRPPARAYLWIPEQCKYVRAVVLGQHNMLEEDILDHPVFRKAMSDLGVAVVWVSPSMDHKANSVESIKRFDAMLADLAAVSGYSELATAPVVPIGHSAHASYPWNFAAFAPGRTLGLLSVHGDAPETPLAGFGPQAIRYPDGALDGVPGLMVMGEYEWIDARWAPAAVYRSAHPKAPIALLAEPGQGHFAACGDLVNFCAMFIRKCIENRLPADTAPGAAPVLKPIDPATGWLVQRWTPRIGRTVPPAPAASFSGDGVDAFWAFDQEMAEAIQKYHAEMVGKLPQLLGFMQDEKLIPATPTHPMVTLKFEPGEDGESFTLKPVFLDSVMSMGQKSDIPGKNNQMRWTGLPAGAAIGHPSGGGPIVVTRIEGPVQSTGLNTFRLQFYRGSAFDKPTAWFAAVHPGDEKYKSAVQQAVMNIAPIKTGKDQAITFDPVTEVPAGTASLKLSATSLAGLPVHYYVREGPAVVDGDTLTLLPVPPRAKYPIPITIVGWQFGRAGDQPVKTAAPVERMIQLTAAR